MLIEYIRLRKRTDGYAAIHRLVLKNCTALSEKAKQTLEQEVADFTVLQEKRAGKYIMDVYIDDDFECAEPEEEE
jgi:hypothetical protein